MSEINMKTIAHLAGVSRATVSRALSTPDMVKPQTRAKILDIMAQCGYVYHAGAAELLKKRADIVGIIVPSVEAHVFANAILTVQDAADDMGMSLQLGISRFSAIKEAAILTQFLVRRVAGVITVGFAEDNEQLLLDMHRNGIPVVVIWDTPGHAKLCQVGYDNAKASARAVQYLVDLGHRTIAMIAGPSSASGRIEDRISGYVATMHDHGLSASPVLHGTTSIEEGERLAYELLSRTPRPTAIYAASDLMAIGALSGVRKRGLRVPEDVSVVGLEDINFAPHASPPLTTVAVPKQEMSITATRLLKQLINREIHPPVSYMLDTKLVVRESCARPKT